jgi:hypothetical protein
MRFHSVDYRERESRKGRRLLLDRGFWFWLPRPLLTCRLRGHKPVVDGTAGFRDQPGARWVCCDRCGVRPEPQGTLNPARFSIGDRWTGSHLGTAPAAGERRLQEAGGAPGPWPRRNEGVFGGQLVIGRNHLCGFQVKVGNAGSEHTLAAHAGLPFLGALYLHTEQFGTWLQRRLVPDGYESRVIEAGIGPGQRLCWGLWTLRDSGSRQGWRAGSVKIDPRDILRGEKRYSYADEGEPVTMTVMLPEGDSYPVAMQLQRQSFGRAKGRRRLSWMVDCDTVPGVPCRTDGHDRMTGWGIPVSGDAVEAGRWPQEAAAACVVKVTALRTRHTRKLPAAAA